MPHRCAIAAFLTSTIALIGCGGDAFPGLSGSVTYNGQPVESGFITFSPTGSGQSFGAKIVDGRYEPEKVQAGQFKVLVRAESEVQVAATREEAAKQAAAGGQKGSPNYIPENAKGNGQTVDIADGAQTLDFALTGPPRQ